MLVNDNGDLSYSERRVAEVEQNLPLHEEDVQYTLTPPRVEIPYAVTDLSGGIGFPQQLPNHRDGYDYAYKIDCSSGIPVQGPAITALGTAVSSDSFGVCSWVEFNGKLYVSTGEHLYSVAADGTVTNVTGALGRISGKMAVFRGSQSGDYLFVPQGSSTNYRVLDTSNTITQHASQKAEGFEAVNDELWLHNTESNQQVIRKATDGGTAATWGGTTVIGDAKHTINWMMNVAGRLIVIKSDGLYGPTIQDESVIDRQLTPELANMADTDNGKRAQVFGGELFWKVKNALFKYNPDSGELANVTPSAGGSATMLFSSVTEIAQQPGIGVWATGNAQIDPFAGGTSKNGYLFRYGGWAPSRNVASDQLREFRRVWHGIVADLNNVISKCLIVTQTMTGQGSQPRLYVLAGTAISYLALAATPAPSDDFNYTTNSDSDGYVVYPWYTCATPLETKILRRVGIAGLNLSAGRTLTAAYRTAPANAFTSIGSVTSDPGSTVNVSGTPASKQFQFKITFAGGGTVANYCRLTGFVAYAAVRSGAYKEIVCQVLTCDNVKDRRQAPAKRSGSDLRSALETAIDGNPITIISPGGESMTVIGLDYDHKLEGFDSTDVARYRTTLRLVEVA